MSFLSERPRLRRLGLALAAVMGIGGALTAISQPANARVWVSVGVPFVGYYAPPPPAYYYRPYRPYYPYRAYYAPRGRNWCYWHPYRCRW